MAASGLLPAGSVPTPVSVIDDLISNVSYYLGNAAPTVVTALEGFAIALVISLVFGAVGSLTGLLERSVSRIALAIYCLPLPALLPLISSLEGSGPPTRITMAVLFSFFPMLIGVLAGLRATPADTAAIVHVAGGGRLQILLKVGLRSALPNIIAGMRIAGPGALLGALVAEFSGADHGLGVALVVSQQKLQTAQTWGVAIVATLIGGVLYGAITAVGRRLHVDPVEGQAATTGAPGTGPLRTVIELLTPVIALIVIWVGLVLFGGASRLVFKSPVAVLNYLTSHRAAAAHREALVSDWLLTMRDTGMIFTAGMVAAFIAGCVLVSFPVLLRLGLPLLIASQCVPQIAFIPLLVAICGRGAAFIVVTGLLVVFFPAMIVIVTALEERSRSTIDVVSVYSGGRWAVLRFVRIPGAVPGILNAARISIPLALFGALVAEWLVTGNGISEAMTTATSTFDYTRLWADVVVVTVTVIVLYEIVAVLHERARRRFSV
ncbi:ABC-type nitrate/sulfonate/bicarbonate transport system permease component [Amycolatopsis bartoniae]|uniref:ABC transporter permease n=1 Tax=Amycolatopsis bartoniae TaxID=941986 RepID=UPI001605B1A7|nr:ABC transporter permease subunit [Amycolatopsis bartoniae]MBB2940001.1 ABC-type nitrate/sulfonate/bicarbonate transport system permease component [Amycolatopsis bartoniae]